MISHDKFEIIAHLGQITNFDHFQGNLGIKWGIKRSKIAQLDKKTHKSKKIAQADGYFFTTLSLIYYTLQFLSLLGTA